MAHDRVDVKTSAETLIHSFMSGEHIGHQQFLKRRTHCHEHEIGPDACHIVNQGRTLGSVAKISVVLSYDADSGYSRRSFSTVAVLTSGLPPII